MSLTGKDLHSPEPTKIDGHPSSGLGHATIRGMAGTADRHGHICRQISAGGSQERRDVVRGGWSCYSGRRIACAAAVK
ncbi:hypothetical protein VP1G_11023 [Cytospora mali]|uniref:Uncharacterized protein n=1 Tax=Cytospora mali TaxID=578113 RepID=A0A194V3C2_CYTMA|nr:hypothetical protein VP1G_11023 [Valsa mali var. pyri (nom. inval.)]